MLRADWSVVEAAAGGVTLQRRAGVALSAGWTGRGGWRLLRDGDGAVMNSVGTRRTLRRALTVLFLVLLVAMLLSLSAELEKHVR